MGLLVLTLGIWSFSQALVFQTEFSILIYIERISISLSAVWFFFFSLEYTIRQSLSNYVKTLVLGLFTLLNALLVTSDSILIEITSNVIMYEYTYELLFQVVYTNFLYIFSIGILLRELLIDIRKDQVQDILLILWGFISLYFVSHVIITSETTVRSIVLCGLSLILIMSLVIFGMKYYELFNLKGISHSNLLQKIEDGYIALDRENNIIERDYSFDKKIDETKVKEFIKSDTDSEIIHVEKEYSTDIYYRLDKKQFKYGTDSYGTLILITEISDVKQKENNLQLLRQVFSRFLRHNIRNRLTVINGFIETLDSEDIDPESKKAISKIKSSTDELIGNSQKALVISNSTAKDTSQKEFTVKEIIENGVTNVDNKLLENARISIHIQKNVTITAHEKISNVVSNAVENAIEHNAEPVEISIVSQYNEETSEVYLEIEDNGSGIDPNEIKVINNESESPLEHGTGIGLWTMKILAKESGGKMEIIGSDAGSEVRYIFIAE